MSAAELAARAESLAFDSGEHDPESAMQILAEAQVYATLAVAAELRALSEARTITAAIEVTASAYCGECGAHADDPHREGCQWYEAPDTTPVGPR